MLNNKQNVFLICFFAVFLSTLVLSANSYAKSKLPTSQYIRFKPILNSQATPADICSLSEQTGFCGNQANPPCPEGEMQYRTSCSISQDTYSCQKDNSCDSLSCFPGFSMVNNQEMCKLTIQSQCNINGYHTELPIMNIPGATNDVSGLAYSPNTNTLFYVDNQNENIYEMSLSGNIIRTIITNGFDDLEGITHVTGNTFAFVEEKRATLNIFTMPEPGDPILTPQNVTQYDLFGTFGNEGFEGVVYHRGLNKYYIVKEANPAKVYEVEISQGSASVTEVFPINNLPCNSLGGITHHPVNDTLLIICKQQRTLIETTLDGNLVASMGVSEFGPLPEGVTMNPTGDKIYMVGEPRHYSVYSNSGCPVPTNQVSPVGSPNNLAWINIGNNYDRDFYAYNTPTKQIYKFTDNDGINQFAPSISNTLGVWIDMRNGNNDIFGYDSISNSEHPIITHLSDQFAPFVQNQKIVWEDNRNGNLDIFYCEFNAQTFECPEQQITFDLNDQILPKLYGQNIVWEDTRDGYSQIYIYNLHTALTQRLSPTNYTQHNPVISDNIVAWRDARDEGWYYPYNKHVYYYNLIDQTEHRVTYTSANHVKLTIYDRFLAWSDNRAGNNNWDIYGYFINQNAEIQVTNTPGNQTSPAIVGTSRWIFWEDSNNGNYSIFGKPVETPESN